MENQSRYESLFLPEVVVRPALLGTVWVVVDRPRSVGPGDQVKARLMRSQLCWGTVRVMGAIMVLDVDVRWWAAQDPDDESFEVPVYSDRGAWMSPDVGQVAS